MNRLHERFPDRYRECYYCAGTGWRPAADTDGRLRNRRCRTCSGVGSVPRISTHDVELDARLMSSGAAPLDEVNKP